MALTKCGSCNNTMFQMVENSHVGNSRYKIMFIQCSRCGAAISTMEYTNTGAEIQELKKKINQLEATINNIDHNIVNLANLIRRK